MSTSFGIEVGCVFLLLYHHERIVATMLYFNLAYDWRGKVNGFDFDSNR